MDNSWVLPARAEARERRSVVREHPAVRSASLAREGNFDGAVEPQSTVVGGQAGPADREVHAIGQCLIDQARPEVVPHDTATAVFEVPGRGLDDQSVAAGGARLSMGRRRRFQVELQLAPV